MDIIKKHYEKVVLGFLLLSFVVALLYLLQIMSSASDTSSGNSAAAKNILVIQRENMPYNFNYTNEKFSLEDQDVSWKERTGEGLIGYGQPGLAVPMKALRCSQCKKIMPWSQLRKNDFRCPFEACSQDLRDPGEPEDYEKQLADFDSDGDGMPDRYEIRLGLNPNSAEDADQDKDGDKFSNWFEFYCNTNPDDPKSVPSLDKMLFLSKIDSVKLPVRLSSITAPDPNDKKSFKIHITAHNQDITLEIGRAFSILGKRYIIVDAVKRNTTAQSTSFSQQQDDSTIWIIPADSKKASDRIEVRSGKDVYDNKTRKVVIRDVRTPKKRRSNLMVGKTFTLKSNNAKDKNGMLFKLTDVTEKSAELEYTVGEKVQKTTLNLVKDGSKLLERLNKAYVESDNSKMDNSNQPAEEPAERPARPSRRSRRR